MKIKVELDILTTLSKYKSCVEDLLKWMCEVECWQEEVSEEIFPILQKYGFVTKEAYCIEEHGRGICANEGDMVWVVKEVK